MGRKTAVELLGLTPVARYGAAGGYVEVYFEDGTRAYEHRWVVTQRVGRELLPDEVVHHVNGNKDDNRPENLVVMLANEHAALHSTSGRTLIALTCPYCEREFYREVRHVAYQKRQGQTRFHCSRRCNALNSRKSGWTGRGTK